MLTNVVNIYFCIFEDDRKFAKIFNKMIWNMQTTPNNSKSFPSFDRGFDILFSANSIVSMVPDSGSWILFPFTASNRDYVETKSLKVFFSFNCCLPT